MNPSPKKAGACPARIYSVYADLSTSRINVRLQNIFGKTTRTMYAKKTGGSLAEATG